MPLQDTTKRPAPIFIRLPNWIGDVCMCLPALELLDKAGLSYIICARDWAQSLLTGLKAEGFIEMTDSLKHNVQALRDWRREYPTHRWGLLMPDSLSSALTFRLAGIQSAGWRDDGRSLLLKWGFTKPSEPMHAVEAWFTLTQRALNSWGIEAQHATLSPTLHLTITNEHKQIGRAHV